ncbi:MAG: preprotein translocase subunit YajC [Gemmatimonadales bacterium]
MLILSLFQTSAAGPNPFGTVFMFGAIFLIFYFLLIRPQRKQQKSHDEMVQSLSRGDEVVTIGGIIGKIVHLTDDRMTIKTADETRLEIERSKIGRKSSGPQAEG